MEEELLQLVSCKMAIAMALRLALLVLIAVAGSLSGQEPDNNDLQTKPFTAVIALLRQGRPAEAEKLLDQMQLRSNQNRIQLGDLKVNTYAFVSSLLTRAYVNVGDYASAERVAKDRLTSAEQQYGKNSFQVAGHLASLANIYRLEGKYKEAMTLYERALFLQRSLKMADCLLGRALFTGLAETYVALKRPADAEQLLSPEIDSCGQKLGRKAIGRSDLLNAYAVALEIDGKKTQAEAAASEADRTGLVAPKFQQEDRDLLRGRLAAARGDYETAVSYCGKWIRIFEVPDGADSDRRLMLPLSECERLFTQAGRPVQASEARKRLVGLQAKYDAF